MITVASSHFIFFRWIRQWRLCLHVFRLEHFCFFRINIGVHWAEWISSICNLTEYRYTQRFFQWRKVFFYCVNCSFMCFILFGQSWIFSKRFLENDNGSGLCVFHCNWTSQVFSSCALHWKLCETRKNGKSSTTICGKVIVTCCALTNI